MCVCVCVLLVCACVCVCVFVCRRGGRGESGAGTGWGFSAAGILVGAGFRAFGIVSLFIAYLKAPCTQIVIVPYIGTLGPKLILSG